MALRFAVAVAPASELPSSKSSRRNTPRLWASVLMVLGLCAAEPGARAQQPLPNTITTVAGGAATATPGAACSAGSPYKAADSFGDGCPGANANFSTDLRGGLASDGQGNIYIADTNNGMVRKYDPRTGLVSRVAGKGTNCTTANGLLDSSGDGCPSQQTVFASTPRGIASDPYGNVFVAGYGSQMVNVICQAASPLCPNTAGRKQVGYMYRVAGCVSAVGTGATSAPTAATPLNTWAGTEGDNTFASPFANLAGDASAGVTGTAAGGTCTSSVGILNQPRGVAADKYGNVYIAETGTTGAGLRYRLVLGPQTSNFFPGTNPLWAIVNGVTYTSTAGTFTYTAHEGYIYTILGGFSGTPSAKGGACGAYFAEDTRGDGCPFIYSNANGGVQGVTADSAGNVIFSDTVNSLLRVLYVGGANNPLTTAIIANSGGSVTAPVPGNVYLLAGGGATGISSAITLGSSTSLGNQYWKAQVGPGGHIYLGGGSADVLFYDVNTGYIRQLFKTGTACAAHVTGSTNGDGCPAAQATYSGGSSAGFGIALDPLGNLYLGDIESGTVAPGNGSFIRKVEATSLVPTTLGSTRADGSANVQTLVFHGPPGAASISVTPQNLPAGITLGTPTCAAPAADTTVDCSVTVTWSPTQPGTQGVQLFVALLDASSNTLSSTRFFASGQAIGSALVTDTATPAVSNTTGITPVGAALDGAGNLYTVDTASGKVLKYSVAGGTTATVGTAPSSPLQISVDPSGNVQVISSATAALSLYNLHSDGTYTPSTSGSGVAQPTAFAFDPIGNGFLADKGSGTLLLFPRNTYSANSVNANTLQTIATGFINPVSIALDGLGNIFVSDLGLPGIYKVAQNNGVYTTTLYAAGSGTPTVTVPGLLSNAIAADAAGNVYVQDATSHNVLMIPVNQTGPVTTTVLSGLTSPSGLAVDGNGVVYSADSGAGKLTQVLRNGLVFPFGTSTSAIFAGTVTNAGNLAATGFQSTGLDLSDFPVTSVSPANCYNTPATPGFACSITSQFTPGSGTGNVSSTLAYAPAASTSGFLQFTGIKTGAAVTTTTTISGQTPANPIFVPSGTEVAFTVSVTASDASIATGAVTVSIDSGAAVGYTLSNGSVTVPLSGLAAGSHTIVAAYATQGGLTGSTSTTTTFSIAQAQTATAWTPGANTQQFSSAIGDSVLNATATITGTSTTVPGYFIYTATPAGGSPQTVHSNTYLPIGTYTLAVTFVPSDSVDFIGSTASAGTYTVTKASTSAPVGASQFVVAADGTGNFSSVQAAVNAVGAAGGNIYIKPGTYSGDVTVVQPNVALRGLGGDPSQVVITHSGGSFSGGVGYEYAGEFTTAQNNGAQLPTGSSLFTGDEGSATLVVAKGINMALGNATLTPNNFFAENLSLVNTHDSDNVTTTTTYVSGGSCTANAGPARTHYDLYNSGLLCASQALAIWITSDLALMNNVYTTSLQDTIYAGSQGGPPYVPSREYWFRGKVTGNVDYIFGDAGAVFDYSTIFTAQRSTATVEAQNKKVQTGSSGDYLSGYIMNSDVFTAASTTQANLYFGRPYGAYSTWLMLNSYVDFVNPLGYEEFSGNTNLPTSTYAEFNTQTYTDPATGSPDLNGIPYLGTGGNSGAGVNGTRETVSQSPGTPMASNAIKTSMTAAQATLYYPQAFLGATVSNSSTGVTNWNVAPSFAARVNGFVPSGSGATVAYGSNVTILMRPQTPGLGAVTNGVYTVPTGTYTLLDGTTQIASGNLDASGEAYLTTSNLAPGTHSLTWSYSGDANFSGSTTAAAYVITVTAAPTTTTLAPPSQTITYGQSASLTATVSVPGSNATPAGTVTLSVDNGSTTLTASVSGNTASFTVPGLTAGSHTFTATYTGTATTASSTSSSAAATVGKAALTVTPACVNRLFDQPNSCSATVTGYQYSDNASTVFTGTPTGATTATRVSPAGSYAVTATNLGLTTAGAANYTLNTGSATFTIGGGVPQAILFAPLPYFVHGATYQLTARATSGQAVTYTVTGPATISGSALTVTGTGPVTVQASSTTDPSGSYAAAAPVSRSFIAQ